MNNSLTVLSRQYCALLLKNIPGSFGPFKSRTLNGGMRGNLSRESNGRPVQSSVKYHCPTCLTITCQLTWQPITKFHKIRSPISLSVVFTYVLNLCFVYPCSPTACFAYQLLWQKHCFLQWIAFYIGSHSTRWRSRLHVGEHCISLDRFLDVHWNTVQHE